MTITNSLVQNSSSTDVDSIIHISGIINHYDCLESTIPLILNFTLHDIEQIVLKFISCEVILAEKLIIDTISLKSSIQLLQSSTMSIQNSQFLNLGSPTLLSGAAIYSENSNLDVKGSLFKNNQAKNGGTLDLQ